jgi:hypothetical protein
MAEDASQGDLELIPPQTSGGDETALGPFAPPADFDHGVEFEGDTPRPIPGWLRKGSFGKRRQGVVLTLAMLGVGCVIFEPLPIVESMSHYFLPLAYLGWIGLGLLALSAIVWLKNRFSMERLAYVRDGIPFVGRVLSVDRPVTQTIIPETKQLVERFQFAAKIEYDDPETRARQETVQFPEDQWDAKAIGEYDPGVEPGEYVTLVALPGRIAETTKLYGFLGLDPDRDFITRNGKPLSGMSPFTAVIIAFAVFGGLWLLITGLYVIFSCFPEEFAWQPGLVFLGLGAVAGIVCMRALLRRERKQSQPTKGETFWGFFGGAVLGLMGGAVSMAIVNAVFDRSPSVYRPVRIDNYWETTHKGIFRTYEVEYTLFGSVKSEKHHAAYDDLARLQGAQHAAVEVHKGALGMEWIKAIHPFGWEFLSDPPTADELQQAVTFEAPGKDGAPPTVIQMLPRLYLDETKTVPAPAELTEVESANFRGRLGIPPQPRP